MSEEFESAGAEQEPAQGSKPAVCEKKPCERCGPSLSPSEGMHTPNGWLCNDAPSYHKREHIRFLNGAVQDRSVIGNPLLDTKVVQESNGLFYVHRIYGDGRYGFERQLSALNPGRETEAEAEADLNHLRRIRADANRKPLSAFD